MSTAHGFVKDFSHPIRSQLLLNTLQINIILNTLGMLSLASLSRQRNAISYKSRKFSTNIFPRNVECFYNIFSLMCLISYGHKKKTDIS